MILKKLPHAPGCHRAREGGRQRQHRNLVPRRSPDRPEEQNYPPLGQAWHPAKRAPRSTQWKTSGSSCATTGSPTAFLHLTTISSITAARHGISSSISLGAS